MTNNFRDLCAELLRGLDENRHPEVRYPGHLRLVMASARAELAKADEPAVPEGREPASVAMQLTEPGAEGPSAEALANFTAWFCRNYPGPDTLIHRPEWHAPKVFRAAAAAIARWGRSVPAPPADGEVAELVRTLTGIAHWRRRGRPGEGDPSPFDIRQADRLDRAAELLERLSPPQPVPVSERLPGPEDMTDDGEVWIEDPGHEYPLADAGDYDWDPHKWILRPIGKFDAQNGLRWLPAHAMPLPEVGE